MDVLVAFFAELYRALTAIPFPYVFALHSVFVASLAPQFKDRFLVHYVLTFVWGNGGGLVTAALLMNPSKAPLSIFASNEVMVIWTLCWWLMNYSPGGLVAALQRQWYVKMVTKQGTSLLRALLIISRVDLAVQLYPGVVAAPLLLGTLAGCGGRLLADALLHSWGDLAGPAELTAPGFASRSGFAAALAYYLGTYVLRLGSRQAVAGMVVSGLLAQSLLAELLGMPLDFTAPLAAALHRCCNVPMPQPVGLPPGKASTSKKVVDVAAESSTPKRASERLTAAAAAAAAAAGGGGSGSAVSLTTTPAVNQLQEAPASTARRRTRRRE